MQRRVFLRLCAASLSAAAAGAACASPPPAAPRGRSGRGRFSVGCRRSTTAPRTAASKTRALSLGRQPNASASSPISQYMLQQKLFEQAAKTFGYELTVDYQDYPSAAPMVELMTAGKLDIGMWGNTPTIRSIAQQQPVTAMTVGEGHLKFVVAVPADSSIHNMSDLKGKTVGALIGGATFNVLSQMLKAEFGEGDPQKLGITVVNTPSAADAARLPRGMDAAVIIDNGAA